MVSRTCRHLIDGTKPCKAAPLRGGDYCLWHDPAHAGDVAEWRRLGGLRRKRESTVAAAYDFEGLGTVPQIRRLVEVAALDVLGLENSIARARALAYLAQVATSLVEKGEWEERLEAVEATLGPRLMRERTLRGRR